MASQRQKRERQRSQEKKIAGRKPSGANPPWPPRKRTLLLALLLVVVGVVTYANSLRGPFIFDDTTWILGNPTTRQLWRIDRILLVPDDLSVVGRPIVNLSLAISYAVSATDPFGYHLTNLLIHLLAALTLFGVIRRTLSLPGMPAHLTRDAGGLAFACALIWLVHPLQTSAVTYIIQRTESLMGLFYLLALYSLIRGSQAVRPIPWFLLAVITCFFGMGTKEVTVSAPVVLLVYDRIFLAGSFGELLRKRWGLYLGLAASWILLAALVSDRSGTV
ncbi:hypothetical protein ACFL6M_07625, partial [Candidatus Eisenbacteria bacterium]